MPKALHTLASRSAELIPRNGLLRPYVRTIAKRLGKDRGQVQRFKVREEPGTKLHIDHNLPRLEQDTLRGAVSLGGARGAEVAFRRFCPWLVDRGYIDVLGTFMPCCYAPHYLEASAAEGLPFKHSLHEQATGEIGNSRDYRLLRQRIAEGAPLFMQGMSCD